MNMEPDYNKYSNQELLEALESIDEIKYFDRAKNIMLLYLKSEQIKVDELRDRYKVGEVSALSDVMTFPISLYGNDKEMSEKIHYILQNM
ncbi:hypothetical protein [Alteromonas oceanisediminis]|uniref:hypothetical protein n=1 Tax=Alteromonas oceanisediminis TaxID=2836180 RepID=UPI001BD988EA|nr:hypothetical protein [Alteromonas oceanisediminis]MBT0587639.1 hypothetical protein [Alteromonas oceanisediminis]